MKIFSFFKLFVLTASLLCSLSTSAQSVSVYMPDVSSVPGETVTIPVSIYCDVDMTAFQMKFATDLGVTFTNAKFVDRIDPSADTYIVPSTGMILAYNYNGIDLASLEAGEGVVAKLYLKIPADAEPGNYTMTLHDMQFIPIGTSGSANTIYLDDFTASLSVNSTTPQAYACYTSSNTTLTFYYDTQRASRPGTTYDLNTGNGVPGWIDNNINRSVTRVAFDSSFADARPTSTHEWFADMRVLQTIEGIGFLNTSEVTNMDYMFFCCQSLTSLDVSNFNTAKVTHMYSMFGGCSGLTSLDVNNFNTAKVTRMDYMFAACTALTSLDLSSFNTTKVTYMNSMFSGCENLRTIYVGSGWNTDAVTYSSQMFYNCTNLVGCKGTTYDANHVDKAYAHIDGGTSYPGYMSRLILGDINSDGKVDVSDVTALIDIVLNSRPVNRAVADLNCDGCIDVSDVTALISGVLNGTMDPEDPHNSGVWLVLLDRDGSEIWYRLYLGTEGSYATTVSLRTTVYGTGRVKFYIVDNGFAYGAPQANQAAMLGDSDSNPLSRGKNYYTVPAGYTYTLGMTFDSNGQRCAYTVQGPACN